MPDVTELVNPSTFRSGLDLLTSSPTGSVNPFKGTRPDWLVDSQPSFIPPSATKGVFDDLWNRRRMADGMWSWMSPQSWVNYYQREGKPLGTTPPDPNFDQEMNYKLIDPDTRRQIAEYGYTEEAYKKSVHNVNDAMRWTQDALDRTESQQFYKDVWDNSGWVYNASMATASAAVNYVGHDPIFIASLGVGGLAASAGRAYLGASLLMGASEPSLTAIYAKTGVALLTANTAAMTAVGAADAYANAANDIAHGLYSWDDVETSDIVIPGLATGGLALLMGGIGHMLNQGGSGFKIIKSVSKSSGSDVAASLAEAVVMNDRATAKQALASSLRKYLGDDAARYRYLLSEDSVYDEVAGKVVMKHIPGVSHDNYDSFVNSMVRLLDELKPTAAELDQILDPTNMNLMGKLARKEVAEAKAELLRSALPDVSPRFSGIDPGTNRNNFDVLRTLDILYTSRKTLPKYMRRQVEKLRKGLREGKAEVDQKTVIGLVHDMEQRTLPNKTLWGTHTFRVTPEMIPGMIERVENRIRNLTAVLEDSIIPRRAPRSVTLGDTPTGVRDAQALARLKLQALKNTHEDLTKQLTWRLQRRDRMFGRVENQKLQTKLMAKEIDSIDKKLASLSKNASDPNTAAKIDRLINRKKVLEAKAKFQKKKVEDRFKIIDKYDQKANLPIATDLSTRYTRAKQSLVNLRAFVETQAKLLEDKTTRAKAKEKITLATASIRKLERFIKRREGLTDPRIAEATTPKLSAAGTPEVPPAGTTLTNRFNELGSSPIQPSVATGINAVSDVANIGVASKLSDLMRRFSMFGSGQTRTVFSKIHNLLWWAAQGVDNTHRINIETGPMSKPFRSLYHYAKGNDARFQREVLGPLGAAIKKHGTAAINKAVAELRAGTRTAFDDLPELAVAMKSIRQWLDTHGENGKRLGVLSKLIDNYLPRSFNAGVIRANYSSFVSDVASVYAEFMSKSANLDTHVLRSLGWIEEVTKDGAVTYKVSQAGLDAGLPDVGKFPERAGLSPTAQAKYTDAIDGVAKEAAIKTYGKVSGDGLLVLDAEGDPHVVDTSGRTQHSGARTMDDEVFSHPKLRPYVEQDLMKTLHEYSNTVGLRIQEQQWMQDQWGVTMPYHEYLDRLHAHIRSELNKAGNTDATVHADLRSAIETLQHKRDALFHTFHLPAESAVIDSLFGKTLPNMIRTAYGGAFGLSALPDLMRTMFVHRDIAEIGRVVADMARFAVDRKRLAEVLGDVGWGMEMFMHTNRMATMPGEAEHGLYAATLGARLAAPWIDAVHVATGRVIPPHSAGRLADTLAAVTNASAMTTIEAGGLRYVTATIRGMAAASAQRLLLRDVEKIAKLYDLMQTVPLSSMDDTARMASFKTLAKQAGLAVDRAMFLNGRGLVTKEGVAMLRDMAAHPRLRKGRWTLNDVRASLRDKDAVERFNAMENRLSDYLIDSVDASVIHPRPFLRNTDATTWISRWFWMLTSYAQAFSSSVGYRDLTQTPVSGVLLSVLMYTTGEAIYRTAKDILYGRASVDETIRKWEEEPQKQIARTVAGVPIAGVFTQGVTGFLAGMSGIQGSYRTGGNPVSDTVGRMAGSLSKAVRWSVGSEDDNGNPVEFSPSDAAVLLDQLPAFSSWWVQGALSGAGLNPRQQSKDYK